MEILIIQRNIPGAPSDQMYNSFDFEQFNNSKVVITVIEIPNKEYESFDNYLVEIDLMNQIKNSDFNVIFIPITFGLSPLSYDGFQLAMHIRLSSALNDKRFTPIVLMGFESLDVLVKLKCPYLSFFSTPEIYYVEESFEGIESFIVDTLPFTNSIGIDDYKSTLYLYPIYPQPNLDSSHSIANEWGAFELDKVSVNIFQSQYRALNNNLYIKYLIEKLDYNDSATGQIDLSSVLNDNQKYVVDPSSPPKVLYIDDEFNKGWSDVLNKIFTEVGVVFDCVYALNKGQTNIEIVKHIIAKIRSNSWDLILLDMRLTEKDHNNSDYREFLGFKVLQFLKGRNVSRNGNLIWKDGVNPVLPIMIFTASNKSKAYDLFLNEGADKFFIKHAPDSSRNISLVKNDVERLFLDIKECFVKHKLLSYYWNYIDEIYKKSLVVEKFFGTADETCFKQRIHERFRMTIGLLKNAFEQSNFNKDAFLYDTYETAFLTLWSVLNEISEMFFYKTNNSSGNIVWQFKHVSTNQIFIQSRGNDFYSTYNIRTPDLKVITARGLSIGSIGNNVDYNLKIQKQIAFIMQKYKPLRDLYNTKLFDRKGPNYNPASHSGLYMCGLQWDIDLTKLLRILYNSNLKRNSLNLTHASSNIKDYKSTIRANGSSVTENEIKDLFKLIYFILNGVCLP